MAKAYVIGVDFGSDSARAVIIDAADGSILAESQYEYERWTKGLYQNPDKSLFRQHPLDYLEALEKVVCNALEKAGKDMRPYIKSIAVDTTGSTPCPTDRSGTPLAILPEFADNENAMFHLWKDHTAISEAIEVDTALSDYNGINYTKYQGTYCSEWYWAKILHTGRADPLVKAASCSWVEHCDWITGELAGNTDPLTMYRCSCAAGHKALWHSEWNGLPGLDCLHSIDPYLAEVARHFGRNVAPSDTAVGKISEKWAKKLGLPKNTLIGGCSLDAHAGAVGAGVREGRLVENIGTSAVAMLVERPENLKNKNLSYACGQAENSILPGYTGIEAGQAAFGDVYAWFKQLLLWPYENLISGGEALTAGQKKNLFKELEYKLIPKLTEQAANLDIENALAALDWFNGRRYPYTNENLKSAVWGLSLGTDAPRLFQSLVLSTIFGFKRIIDSFIKEGLHIEDIIAVGGIPKKSSFIMQTMADVLNYNINVSASSQACARGAAIYAAVAGGLYRNIEAAQDNICENFIKTYLPDSEKFKQYEIIYRKYCMLGGFAEKMS